MKRWIWTVKVSSRCVGRTLANYVIWNMVMNRVSNLPEKFLDLRTDFNKVLTLRMSQIIHWRPTVQVPLDAGERSSFISNYWDPAFPRLKFHKNVLWPTTTCFGAVLLSVIFHFKQCWRRTASVRAYCGFVRMTLMSAKWYSVLDCLVL